jgi:magnesium chelatase family protein
MVARVKTVAFEGVDVLDIDVQVQISSGMVAFTLVGLPDKAVTESRERVRAALHALGLSLPAKRITVNLAPADVMKEGSHFDLPIALALLVAMDVVPQDAVDGYIALGELALDGTLTPVSGVLPAAIAANARDCGVICPLLNGGEALWASEKMQVLAPPSLLSLINHFKGTQVMHAPERKLALENRVLPDLRDIKGQEAAKRALEVVAAGGHNLLMMGPPGSGKSMLASRLPSLLPPLEVEEALEVSMIHSIAGMLKGGRLLRQRPFRDPHHSASLPALIGGGTKAKPGEVSLAHHGVLFLDELPEFQRATLEALRQPLESGRAVVARANHHVAYPARFQLIAAMNPCRCGYLGDAAQACNKAPLCGSDYQSKISGPLLDRIDCHVDVPAVSPHDLTLPVPKEDSLRVAARIAEARRRQKERYAALESPVPLRCNAEADGELLQKIAAPDEAGQALLTKAIDQLRLSARGYARVLRVARTLADMEGVDGVRRGHVAEALSYRKLSAAKR